MEELKTPVLVEDRRHERRAPFSTLITAHNFASHLVGRACNISRGGLGIESNVIPPQGTLLNLHFRLPSQAEPVVCRAMVIRRRTEQPPFWAVVFLEEDRPTWGPPVDAFIRRHQLTGHA